MPSFWEKAMLRYYLYMSNDTRPEKSDKFVKSISEFITHGAERVAFAGDADAIFVDSVCRGSAFGLKSRYYYKKVYLIEETLDGAIIYNLPKGD